MPAGMLRDRSAATGAPLFCAQLPSSETGARPWPVNMHSAFADPPFTSRYCFLVPPRFKLWGRRRAGRAPDAHPPTPAPCTYQCCLQAVQWHNADLCEPRYSLDQGADGNIVCKGLPHGNYSGLLPGLPVVWRPAQLVARLAPLSCSKPLLRCLCPFNIQSKQFAELLHNSLAGPAS